MNNSTKNTFFLDIFNKILKVNNNEIIILYNKDGEPWFGLKDIIIALGYSNYKKANTLLKINKNDISNHES